MIANAPRHVVGGHAPASVFTSQLPRRTAQLKSLRQYAESDKSATASAEGAIVVHFQGAKKTVTANPGDNIYDLAEKNNVDTITVGCCSGSCGVCEVEVRKYDDVEGLIGDAVPIVVRSCVTPLPPGYARIEINELIDDAWGLDGYDT